MLEVVLKSLALTGVLGFALYRIVMWCRIYYDTCPRARMTCHRYKAHLYLPLGKEVVVWGLVPRAHRGLWASELLSPYPEGTELVMMRETFFGLVRDKYYIRIDDQVVAKEKSP